MDFLKLESRLVTALLDVEEFLLRRPGPYREVLRRGGPEGRRLLQRILDRAADLNPLLRQRGPCRTGVAYWLAAVCAGAEGGALFSLRSAIESGVDGRWTDAG